MIISKVPVGPTYACAGNYSSRSQSAESTTDQVLRNIYNSENECSDFRETVERNSSIFMHPIMHPWTRHRSILWSTHAMRRLLRADVERHAPTRYDERHALYITMCQLLTFLMNTFCLHPSSWPPCIGSLRLFSHRPSAVCI